MNATSKRYHLLLTTLEASTIRVVTRLHKRGAPAMYIKRIIHGGQLQASSLGSQLGHAQLEDVLQDNPPTHGYAAIQPVKIDAGITIGMLTVVARTALIEAYRSAAIAVYAANQVDGWIWEVEGDNPCNFCLSMDGTIHPLSEEFESHPNCRCSTTPSIA